MERRKIGFGIGIVIALCLLAMIALPMSVQAADGGGVTKVVTTTPEAEALALEGISVRVYFLNFTYAMPSGRSPGPLSDQWYVTGTVRNEEGKIIAEKRSGIYYTGEEGHFLDIEIWKDVPKEGDKVAITLSPRTYALGYCIDIDPAEVYFRTPHDPRGRQHTIDYVIGAEQEGWAIGRTGLFSVPADINGKLHYKIETIGLESGEQVGGAKGCIKYPDYAPCTEEQCTIPEDRVVFGQSIDLLCEAWNCGEQGGFIEASIYNANTGKILVANRSYCDAGDRNSTVIARASIGTTIEDLEEPIVLSYRASHWDDEEAKWIRDDAKFERVIVEFPVLPGAPITSILPITPKPTITLVPPLVTPTPTSLVTPVPAVATTPVPTPMLPKPAEEVVTGEQGRERSIGDIFAGWLAWLKERIAIRQDRR